MAAVALAAIVVAGCSKNAGSAAERYIVDDMQEDIGLGELEPECTQPEVYEAGQTFDCTATAEDGRVVTLEGKMTDEDTFDLYTSNLLTATDVVDIRTAGADVLGPEVGALIDPADIVCPDEIVLLDDTGDFTCEITDSTTGEVYGLVVSTGGIEPGVGVRQLNFRITDKLR